MAHITGSLIWIGARARWMLALGVVAAALLPSLSALLRPVLPVLVALLFCVAMVRVDLRAVAERALRPRRLAVLTGWTLALLVAAPVLLWLAGRVLGLGPDALAALVYTGAAPPITSAAGLCLLLGLEAAFALELTVVASLATPLIGPLVVQALLGEAVPIDGWGMALRVAAMIAAGAAAAILLRRLMGPRRIAAVAPAFDGIGALAILAFVVPLFDGVWPLLAARPGLGLEVLALAVAVNFGMQGLVAMTLRGALGGRLAGAAGLAFGNRTVAIYLAALPPDPVFGLYVALYQIPMLFTPLLMGRVLRGREE